MKKSPFNKKPKQPSGSNVSALIQNLQQQPASPVGASPKITGNERIGESEFNKRLAIQQYFASGASALGKPGAPKGSARDDLITEIFENDAKQLTIEKINKAITAATDSVSIHADFNQKHSALRAQLQMQYQSAISFVAVSSDETKNEEEDDIFNFGSVPNFAPPPVPSVTFEEITIMPSLPNTPPPAIPTRTAIKVGAGSSRQFFLPPQSINANNNNNNNAQNSLIIAEDDLVMDVTTPEGQLFAIQSLVEGCIDPYEAYLIQSNYVTKQNQVTRNGEQHIARHAHKGFNALYTLHNGLSQASTPDEAWAAVFQSVARIWEPGYKPHAADFEPLLINAFANTFAGYEPNTPELNNAHTFEGFFQLMEDQKAKLTPSTGPTI